MVPCLALSRLRLGTHLSYLIKNFTGAEAKPERRKIPEVRIRGNVAQCFALSRLRLGTLLSNRIKNFTGAERKPERQKIPEIRNQG